ncbi:hypothetical protein [Aestuariibius sp. HNIBRBA575]|uniref:hypothetical protein n=1 Tax=Aestuariibius sp. HNIBRBA575 TaxID=3233343 RepID=UPI0034A516A8
MKLLLCGREKELKILAECWQRVSDVQNPEPQLVILKAERGVGKTRLALEFYRWLSENVDKRGPNGYWPDSAAVLKRSLDVNPDPYDCKYDQPIPFLWWGLRAADSGLENAISGDAVATYDRFLAPHLVALSMRARSLKTGTALLGVWAQFAKGEAASWSGYDTVITAGESLLKTVSILKGSAAKTQRLAAKEIGERPISRVDAILEDLEASFNPRSLTFAKTPGVIFIDDAQFATNDPGLSVFVERLLYTAMKQSWPVLILATHWKRELSPEFVDTERSFAGIYHHALSGSSAANGPAAGLPGGFLNDENTVEIDLPPVLDLSQALTAALPGLLPDQANALLEHAGGNPRHLEQIIAFLDENEDFFEDFDPTNALTEEGLEEALRETHDIFKVVMRRLRDAPIEVQEAICLASLQGIRFVSDVVEDLAKSFLDESREGKLDQAISPYSMVSREQSKLIAEFSERLFYLVAEKRRKSLKTLRDEVTLRETLKDILLKRMHCLDVDNLSDHASATLICDSVASLFSSEAPEIGMNALVKLCAVENHCNSSLAALSAAERFVDLYKLQLKENYVPSFEGEITLFVQAEDPEGIVGTSFEDMYGMRLEEIAFDLDHHAVLDCIYTLISYGQLSDAKLIGIFRLAEARRKFQENQTPENQRHIASLLAAIGIAANDSMDHYGSSQAFIESLALRRELYEIEEDPKDKRCIASLLLSIGRIDLVNLDPDHAAIAFDEALLIMRNLAEHLGTPESELDLVAILDAIGDMALSQRDLDAADLAFGEGLNISRKLAAQLDEPDSLRSTVVFLIKCGDVAEERGDLGAAARAYDEGLNIARSIVNVRSNPQNFRDIAILLMRIGNLAERNSSFDEASRAYEESTDILWDLADQLHTAESHQDLARSLSRASRVAKIKGDLNATARPYDKGLRIRRELAEKLGTEKSRLVFADWLIWIGNWEKDFDLKNMAYLEGANILRNLPQDFNTQQNLRKFSSLLKRIGDLAFEQNDMDAAVRAFEERLEIHWSIEEVESTEYSLYDLCNAQTRLAEVYQKTRREIAAHKLIREGLVLSAKLPDYWRDVMTEGFVNLRDATKSNS